MSKFSPHRPTSATGSPAPSTSAASEPQFAELKSRYEALKERKMALRMQANHVAQAIAECQTTAQTEFGVTSLEALEAFAREQADKEARERDQFLADLEAEEQQVQAIEQQLEQLGN